MAHIRKFGQLDVVDKPQCIHLRSKSIYVTGEFDPDHPDEIRPDEDRCWCNRTQHIVGPDNEVVERPLCTNGRSCYRATRG